MSGRYQWLAWRTIGSSPDATRPCCIASPGRLGGDHTVRGRIVGGWAGIDSISKRGIFGRWSPKQLTERQVDVLRELGVQGFILPNGDRYEILEGEEACENVALWEAPLEDRWEPKCPSCMRPAVLVEVVARDVERTR